jgi:hypothetical protein
MGKSIASQTRCPHRVPVRAASPSESGEGTASTRMPGDVGKGRMIWWQNNSMQIEENDSSNSRKP